MIYEVPRPVKLQYGGLNPYEIRSEQYYKDSLYENEHLEDKVVSEPYVVTSEMIENDMQLSYLAWLKSKIKFDRNGKEMEHNFEHVSRQISPQIEITCKFCVRDGKYL